MGLVVCAVGVETTEAGAVGEGITVEAGEVEAVEGAVVARLRQMVMKMREREEGQSCEAHLR